MELDYNRSYHPALAVGYLTVFFCLVFIAIVGVTGIIPLALQPPLMFSVLITIIIGGTISLTGYFKSYDRKGYPIMIIVLFIPVIVVIIYALTHDSNPETCQNHCIYLD